MNEVNFNPPICKWKAESAIFNIIAEHDSHTDTDQTEKLEWHVVEGFALAITA